MVHTEFGYTQDLHIKMVREVIRLLQGYSFMQTLKLERQDNLEIAAADLKVQRFTTLLQNKKYCIILFLKKSLLKSLLVLSYTFSKILLVSIIRCTSRNVMKCKTITYLLRFNINKFFRR